MLLQKRLKNAVGTERNQLDPSMFQRKKKSGRGVRIGTYTTRRGKTKCKRVKDNRLKAGAKVEEGTI